MHCIKILFLQILGIVTKNSNKQYKYRKVKSKILAQSVKKIFEKDRGKENDLTGLLWHSNFVLFCLPQHAKKFSSIKRPISHLWYFQGETHKELQVETCSLDKVVALL